MIGAISDRGITIRSGLLEPMDDFMADRGFNLREMQH